MRGSQTQKSNFGHAPLILVSPNTEMKSSEFGDQCISLAETYQQALIKAGGLPLALPGSAAREIVAECVRRADGILFTGGDDINPDLYVAGLSPELRATVTLEPGERDLRELILVDEIFKQRKPVLAICRGHQLMNVALGGTLVVDIAMEVPGAINHQRMDKKSEIVHEAELLADSRLAKITGRRTLGVNSTHHQAVGRVAPPLRVTAASADGVVEGLELRLEESQMLPYLMTVQFHPERLAREHPEHQALFADFVQACVANRDSAL